MLKRSGKKIKSSEYFISDVAFQQYLKKAAYKKNTMIKIYFANACSITDVVCDNFQPLKSISTCYIYILFGYSPKHQHH